jgi:hypothetical protein
MPQNKHEPPPISSHTCANCKFWLVHKVQKVVMVQLPNGQQGGADYYQAYEQALQSGQLASFLQNQEWMIASDCTFSPQWAKVTNNHWCHQFELRMKH